MAAIATAINVLGVLFLSHAVYSAYEHSLLPSASTPSMLSHSLLPASLDPKITLPLDITLETLFSVLLLCAGMVLSSADLKPIQWRAWAGRLEASQEAREVKEVGVGGGNPYQALEERVGFWDISGVGKATRGWMDGGGDKKGKGRV
ncbi:hypothetical protein LTR02_005717 [Friedmanniomyces endolithicus]|uniref:Magnesium transporter n=2 Tax=Dothideomycetidae TaxID=451867 RepID=A0A4U0UVS6_9PEZI|nr:hypothetical protein LTS09_010223 [Friedmanniomyces endolithicus]KAK5148324.1 hypothetical protein LTR32_000365 [Rachicladosporium monterosium]KAK0366786.1 hypothetical protein LTR94_001545 [Friedmanniomyces endolithicus]KAK0798958.1 hypothetical protein LTR75_009365 [Friedmanniomyces endolithicus]KAK0810310.1 hypothetical protein LTR59_002303 [Friedmanniomyces endolithicus]